MISLCRHCEGNGKAYYVVECQLPSRKANHTKSRRFRCDSRGFEDTDALTRALQFGCGTDGWTGFRSFLLSEPDGIAGQDMQRKKLRSFVCTRRNERIGLRFATAMCRLENGLVRSVSFLCEEGKDAEDSSVKRAVLFLRSAALNSWRKGLHLDALSVDGSDSHGRERALKHECALVEIEGGEKVDCACGKNQSRGLMLACEQCGAWEHADCQGFRSDKQIPADYICSACMREEKEEVVIIRTQEQGEEWERATQLLRAPVGTSKGKEKERGEEEPYCCVCGCEDNEDFEEMIHPCACDNGSALAHPACLAAAGWAGQLISSPKGMSRQNRASCQYCGGRGGEASGILVPRTLARGETSGGMEDKVVVVQSNAQNGTNKVIIRRVATSRGTKRLRSALANGSFKETKAGLAGERCLMNGKAEEDDDSRKANGTERMDWKMGEKKQRELKVMKTEVKSKPQEVKSERNGQDTGAGKLEAGLEGMSWSRVEEEAPAGNSADPKVTNGARMDGAVPVVPVLGRRFSDAEAASVPIKKRKLHLMEMMRSPSPLRRSPSPLHHESWPVEESGPGSEQAERGTEAQAQEDEEPRTENGVKGGDGYADDAGITKARDLGDGDTPMEDADTAEEDEEEERNGENHKGGTKRESESVDPFEQSRPVDRGTGDGEGEEGNADQEYRPHMEGGGREEDGEVVEERGDPDEVGEGEVHDDPVSIEVQQDNMLEDKQRGGEEGSLQERSGMLVGLFEVAEVAAAEYERLEQERLRSHQQEKHLEELDGSERLDRWKQGRGAEEKKGVGTPEKRYEHLEEWNGKGKRHFKAEPIGWSDPNISEANNQRDGAEYLESSSAERERGGYREMTERVYLHCPAEGEEAGWQHAAGREEAWQGQQLKGNSMTAGKHIRADRDLIDLNAPGEAEECVDVSARVDAIDVSPSPPGAGEDAVASDNGANFVVIPSQAAESELWRQQRGSLSVAQDGGAMRFQEVPSAGQEAKESGGGSQLVAMERSQGKSRVEHGNEDEQVVKGAGAEIEADSGGLAAGFYGLLAKGKAEMEQKRDALEESDGWKMREYAKEQRAVASEELAVAQEACMAEQRDEQERALEGEIEGQDENAGQQTSVEGVDGLQIEETRGELETAAERAGREGGYEEYDRAVTPSFFEQGRKWEERSNSAVNAAEELSEDDVGGHAADVQCDAEVETQARSNSAATWHDVGRTARAGWESKEEEQEPDLRRSDASGEGNGTAYEQELGAEDDVEECDGHKAAPVEKRVPQEQRMAEAGAEERKEEDEDQRVREDRDDGRWSTRMEVAVQKKEEQSHAGVEVDEETGGRESVGPLKAGPRPAELGRRAEMEEDSDMEKVDYEDSDVSMEEPEAPQEAQEDGEGVAHKRGGREEEVQDVPHRETGGVGYPLHDAERARDAEVEGGEHRETMWRGSTEEDSRVEQRKKEEEITVKRTSEEESHRQGWMKEIRDGHEGGKEEKGMTRALEGSGEKPDELVHSREANREKWSSMTEHEGPRMAGDPERRGEGEVERKGKGEEREQARDPSVGRGGASGENSREEVQETLARSSSGSGRWAESAPARPRSSGWDLLPEGFQRAEDARKAVQDGKLKFGPGSSRGSLAPFGGFSGSSTPREGAEGRRAIRLGLPRVGSGGAGDKEEGWGARKSMSRSRRLEDAEMSPHVLSPRESLGKAHGRGGAIGRDRDQLEGHILEGPGLGGPLWRGPGRPASPPRGRFVDGLGFPPVPRPNAAALAAAKVESNGFVVGPDGTITRAGNVVGPGPMGRIPPGFPPVGRGGRGPGMFGIGRGPGLGVGMGLGLGMIRGMGLGRGIGMGPSIGLGMGLGMGVGPGLGMGFGPGGMGRGALGEHFMGGPFGPGLGGPMMGGRHGRGPPGLEEPEGWPQRRRSLSPPGRAARRMDDGLRLASPPRLRGISPYRPRRASPPRGVSPRRRSRSRTRSRSRSPRRRSQESGEGPGGRTERRSRSPSSRSGRGDGAKGELSPHRRRAPAPPKLPLPPPPPKNQRSPPGGSRGEREYERERGRDRERMEEREREREREILKDRGRDRERDGERERERDGEREGDREREREIGRERGREKEREMDWNSHLRPLPRRTSPFLLHGSTLTDKRDLELLRAVRGLASPSKEKGAGRDAHSDRERGEEGARSKRSDDEQGRTGSRRDRSPKRGGSRQEESARGIDRDDRGEESRRASREREEGNAKHRRG